MGAMTLLPQSGPLTAAGVDLPFELFLDSADLVR